MWLVEFARRLKAQASIERLVVLVLIAAAVIGVLLLTNHHDLTVYNNIMGGNGQ